MSKTSYEIIQNPNLSGVETLVVNHACGHVSKYAFSTGFAKHYLEGPNSYLKDKCWLCNYRESSEYLEHQKTYGNANGSKQ